MATFHQNDLCFHSTIEEMKPCHLATSLAQVSEYNSNVDFLPLFLVKNGMQLHTIHFEEVKFLKFSVVAG